MRDKGRYIFWGIVILILIVSAGLSRLYVDWLWFKSLDLGSVFTISLVSKLAVNVVGFIFAFIFIFINLNITRQYAQQRRNTKVNDDPDVIVLNEITPWQRFLSHRYAGWFFALTSILLALMVSSGLGNKWITIQQYLHQAAFGLKDPIFGKDVGFYVFSLPMFRMIYGYLLGLLVITLVAVSIVYLVTVTFEIFLMEWENVSFATKHLGILTALIMLVIAAGYQLRSYGILFSASGVVYGAGYTDVHARLLAYRVLFIVALITAVLILVNLVIKRVRWILYSLGAWLVLAVVLGGVYPLLIQKLVVVPNEYNTEAPYIEHAIKFTRTAYNLDQILSRNFNIDYNLTADDLKNNMPTIKNIRLWDWQPLRTTYRQIQEIRNYYVFNDVDVDRYWINNEYRQVMLSAREFTSDGLPQQAKTWVNQRLQYTHGTGLAMSPVNEIAREGLPNLIIKDIPPRFTTDLKIKNPSIYYGEEDYDYVIVKTDTKEFDYPLGDKNVYTTYKANSGLAIGNIWKRLVFAYVFKDYKLLISNQVNSDSRILMNRNIMTIVHKIAPFLTYDRDPYIVIADGKLYWFIDAYTTTNMFPYSEPYGEQGINYIRNSVKVVIDAYTGQPTFYVADSNDPIIKSYSSIFPGMFVPIAQMPEALKSHIRYPEDMFAVQTQMLTTYHMTDPRVFYYKEDKWNIPQEIFGNERVEMKPYYTIMKLPEMDREEYVLMMPFTPNTKQNMIAWLAARSDVPNYGKLVLYLFPKQELTFGPMQVESRINQDSEISQELTLWDQKGSRIFRGNLLVIPIENSILYVEPLYLQAQQSQLPELKRIIAVYGDKVVMQPTLEEALSQLFGADVISRPTGEVSPSEPTGKETVAQLIAEANRLFAQAENSLKAGDWAGYGDNQAQLREILKLLLKESNQNQAPDVVSQ